MNTTLYLFSGHGEFVASVFNGIARIFQGGMMTSLIALFAMVGGLWAALRAILHSNFGLLGKGFLLPSFCLLTFCVTPQTTLHIHDTVNRTTHSVGHVPAVLAFFSVFPSQISFALSQRIEEELKIPERSFSSVTGLMFGAKLLSNAKHARVHDPILCENGKNFMRQCFVKPIIMGNILGNRKEAETTSDLFSFIQNNKIHNFGFYWKDAQGNTTFRTCYDVTPTLLKDLTNETLSPAFLRRLGLTLGVTSSDTKKSGSSSNLPTNDLLRSLREQGDGALQALGTATTSAHAWVKQAMMLNLYRQGLDDWRETAGFPRHFPELVSMNATRGFAQQSFGWLTAGEMAGSFLPLLHTIMFALLACSILVVLPASLLPGGMDIFKIWAQGMIWVQTWPIFFSILHGLGMNLLGNHISGLPQNYGMDKITQDDFSSFLMYAYSMVQFLSTLIPVISWMIISKSAYGLTSLVQAMSPAPFATSLGVAAADNNMSLDTVSMGNRTLSQQTMGPHTDISRSWNTGAMKTTQGGDQTFVAKAMSSLPVTYKASQMMSESLSDSYQQQASQLTALSDRSSVLSSLEESQLQDYAARWASSKDVSQDDKVQMADAMRSVASADINNAENYNGSASKSTSARTGYGSFGGRVASYGVDAKNDEAITHGKSAGTHQSYLDSLSKVREYAQTHDLKESQGTSNTLSTSLQDTWRQQEQTGRDITTTKQQMESLHHQRTSLAQSSAAMDAVLNDKLMDHIVTTKGFTKEEAATYMETHPHETKDLLQDVVQKEYGMPHYGKSLPQPSSLGIDLSKAQKDYLQEKERLSQSFMNKKVTPKTSIPNSPQSLRENVEGALASPALKQPDLQGIPQDVTRGIANKKDAITQEKNRSQGVYDETGEWTLDRATSKLFWNRQKNPLSTEPSNKTKK